MITIASPVHRLESRDDLAAVIQAYFDEYADRFGDLALTREIGVSVDAVRVRAWIPREPWSLSPLAAVDRGVDAARKGERECWWEPDGFTGTPVYDYGKVGPGHRLEGPAVVEAADTTILIEPGWAGAMDEYGFFTLSQEAGR